MQTNVLNLRGEVLRTIDLDDRVFGIRPNQAVVWQAVVTQQANARQGTHDTKTRGEVAGGGKKPYRQKGTGNARQGSTRAPHWRKGGVVFGPHPRSYEKAMPRKMRRLAVRSVLSARVSEQALMVIDAFDIEQGKTKLLVQAMAGIGAADGALVVLGERNDMLLRAAKNLDTVHVVTPTGMNLLDMLRLPRLILTESAVQLLTRTLTSDLPVQYPGLPEADAAGAESPKRRSAAKPRVRTAEAPETGPHPEAKKRAASPTRKTAAPAADPVSDTPSEPALESTEA